MGFASLDCAQPTIMMTINPQLRVGHVIQGNGNEAVEKGEKGYVYRNS
jgi:hypothetical protein